MKKISGTKFFAVILLILPSFFSAQAQTVQPTPNKPVKNSSPPMQSPNRPAEGADNPDVTATAATAKVSCLSVNLKLSQNNDLKGAAIYLLDADFGKVGDKNTLLDKFARGGKTAETSLAVISSHLKQSTLTDADGRANFQNVARGKYFLLAVYRSHKTNFAWNLKINADQKTVEINLTARNAFYKK